MAFMDRMVRVAWYVAVGVTVGLLWGAGYDVLSTLIGVTGWMAFAEAYRTTEE